MITVGDRLDRGGAIVGMHRTNGIKIREKRTVLVNTANRVFFCLRVDDIAVGVRGALRGRKADPFVSAAIINSVCVRAVDRLPAQDRSVLAVCDR